MKTRLILVLISIAVIIITGFRNPGFNIIISGRLFSQIKQDSTKSGYWINIDTFDLTVIPPSSGVQFYRDGIIYLSSSKYEGRMPFNHASFGNKSAHYASIRINTLENPRIFSSAEQFIYPCEAITFTNDYKIMYYTKISEKEGAEKIFRAKNNSESEWIFEKKALDFCTGESIYSHPALSSDGKLMIFASNRKGSKGGMDLFFSKEKDGDWSEPINLGSFVNSTANELYPFLDSENNLFFSTDGIEGFGGYDIYICKYNGNTWENPINLSSYINTKHDDVAFTIDRRKGKTGFYTIKQKDARKSNILCKIEMNISIPDTLLTLSQYFSMPEIPPKVIPKRELSATNIDIVYQTTGGTDTIKNKAHNTLKDSAEYEIRKDFESGSDINADKVQKPESLKAEVIYRIQFLSSNNKMGSYKIIISGKEYATYEYIYSGAYRSTVGEFRTVTEASQFQREVRQSGYPQAFVVAFINNVRSNDPELFR